MKSLLASARCDGGLDRVDLAVELLEDEWRRHGQVDLKRLWTEQKRLLADEHDDPILLLSELIKSDLRCRYARGQSPSVTEYLEVFSELRDSDSRVLSLIYEQYCLGEERGDEIDIDSFCARYPRWKDSLLSQLQYHRLFSQAAGVRAEPPRYPNPGDTFEEFQLVSLLGEGGTSRVFLARDLSLGGKQVVLKVSLDRGQEPKAQGALEHRHIVPVNSVVFGDRHLRGLSMPFRPGLPLDTLIKRIKPGNRPRSALALWQVLVEGTPVPTDSTAPEAAEGLGQPADIRAAGPQGDGWEGFPVRGTYPQGVAWIVMIVAQALDYAHRMRTFHRDVKPGNVLLTLEYGPQLLDFNLAESPHSVAQAEAAMHGGTLPYMAPEQIQAFLDPALWGKVGGKADIYSLGLVMRELLTGQQPDLPPETISPQRAMLLLLDRRPRLDVAVSRSNPDIPHALEAILARCLAFSPDERYPDARALAEDLHRFLDRWPLVHAVNPSRSERVVNWIVRNRGTIVAAAAASLIVTLLATPAGIWYEKHFVPVETSQPFQSVVQNMDQGEHLKPGQPTQEMVRPLDGLIKTYTESWQPKVYLSFVRDVGDPSGAESLFREALDVPDAREQMLAWGRKHPAFAKHLERFGVGRFEHAKAILKERPDAGHEERRKIQREHVALAREALGIAVELEPDADQVVKYLVYAEQIMGHYRDAYDRTDRWIKSIISQCEADPTGLELRRRLIEPRLIQCDVAIEWADNLRRRGSAADARAAHELLESAERMAKYCANILNASKGRWLIQKRDYIEYQMMLAIGLAEAEIDLGLLPFAEDHLRHAARKFREYEELLPIDNRKISGEDREHQERLNHASFLTHLKQAAGAIGGPVLSHEAASPSDGRQPQRGDRPGNST